MKKEKLKGKKARAGFFAFLFFHFSFLIFLSCGVQENFSAKYAGVNLGGASSGRTNTYTRYLERYARIPAAVSDIPIGIFSWTGAAGVSVLENFEGEGRALRTEEESFVEYTVNVEQAGMYNVRIEYYPLPSRGINIERSLKINGETPFLGADRLAFFPHLGRRARRVPP